MTASEHLVAVEHYLADRFASMGYRVARRPFEALNGSYRNVVARHRSPSPSSNLPSILIGAREDMVPGSPGARDNASALAVLLEAARAFIELLFTQPIQFVAFNLEEQGLLESSDYTATMRQQRETMTGAIILECVGYARSEPGTQRVLPGVPVAVPPSVIFWPRSAIKPHRHWR